MDIHTYAKRAYGTRSDWHTHVHARARAHTHPHTHNANRWCIDLPETQIQSLVYVSIALWSVQ